MAGLFSHRAVFRSTVDPFIDIGKIGLPRLQGAASAARKANLFDDRAIGITLDRLKSVGWAV